MQHLGMERKHLRSFDLTPPDYRINPQALTDGCVEKEIQFAGIVPNIAMHLDPTNRTDILKFIDKAKKQTFLPYETTSEHRAVLSLSAYSLIILRRNPAEQLILVVAIHEIAAVCYIRDDGNHLLVLKIGDPENNKETCTLAVIYLESKSAAEELCALVRQCFELVYTEAARTFFEEKIKQEGRDDTSFANSEDSVSTSHSRALGLGPSFITGSQENISRVSLASPRGRRGSKSESELSGGGNEVIHDYMKQLHARMTGQELRQFAILLRRWHTDLPFGEFLQKVFELYGPDRKYLLPEMRPFIPDKDCPYFENFLERIGIRNSDSSGYPVYIKHGSPSRRIMNIRYQEEFSSRPSHSHRDSTTAYSENYLYDREIASQIRSMSDEFRSYHSRQERRDHGQRKSHYKP